MRDNYLEGLPRLDLGDSGLDHFPVVSGGPLAPDLQVGESLLHRLHQRGHRFAQLPGHFLDAGHGLVVCPLDPRIGAVVVDGVEDQVHLLRLVIQDRNLGRKHHHQFRKPEIVSAGVWQRLQPPRDVVPQVADHSSMEWRQALSGGRSQFRQRLLQDAEGVAVTDAGQFPAQPDRFPTVLGESGGRMHTDEGIPRPHTLRCRLQEESPLPGSAQGGVQADRRQVVCQQAGVNTDDAPGSRQLRELCKGRRDIQHSTSLPVRSVKKHVRLPV